MKNIIYVMVLLISSTLTQTVKAQELKLKDNVVLLGDKPAFSFDKKAMNNEFHLYKLNTQEELVVLKHQHVGADTGAQDDFKKIIFAKQNIVIESKVLQKRNWKFLIQLLLDEKVLDPSTGTVDVKNLERFAGKYDEKITPRK
ncbi:hypothetical protein [Flavobacterium phycosphaerae]|uniref:hypothetical protein n=1 Tax=Flavobacterium phycosphaerae TaxID=2697515 RepID=UPI001389A150|nr:hypothetical protein [Flavobacterium phycosphaerae]